MRDMWGKLEISYRKRRFFIVKKYIAEFIGTLVLVTMGCGTAMLVGCDAANGGGYILTALAFGLVIVGMAYCVGNISGCHINPAVSLGVLLSGGMTVRDFVGYVVSQCLGALAGAGLLAAMDWRVMLICLVAFIIIVAATRYVSLGSLVVVSLFLIGMIFFGSRGDYGLAPQLLTEFYVLSAAVTAMAFWRHRANIVRLIHGNENKISIGHAK